MSSDKNKSRFKRILSQQELLERIRKIAVTDNFIVHGFVGEYKGHKSILDCECLIDGHCWKPTVNNVLSKGSRCPMCRDTKLREERRFSEEEAYNKCERICTDMNYKPVGFPAGYINQQSYFEYECPKHGNHKVLFNNFVIRGRRCPLCWEDRRKIMCSGFYGYYPERKNEQDFLYVLDFDGKFLKVGRSFDIGERIKGLRHESKFPIKKIHKLRVFTATHQEIYNLEQELHSELRERNFQHCVDWSKECFEKDCLFILNKLLDISGLEEVL